MQSSAQRRLPIIGTRGSPLAQAQAQLVRDKLALAHGLDRAAIRIEIIKTSGDQTQAENLPLSALGGKGLFSKEIEAALLAGDIDLGVHSAKDMATELPTGLVMDVFLEREDVRDAFLSHKVKRLEDLAQGAVVGTSSIRRAAQLRNYRPDLNIVEFRGNVGTRLEKLTAGEADATLLAVAGLNRTGQQSRIASLLDPLRFLPAPAQGAIGIEYRVDDVEMRALCGVLNHSATSIMIRSERAMLHALDGSCRTPIGAFSRIEGGRLHLAGQVLSPDGRQKHDCVRSGPSEAPEQLGQEVGLALLDAAGPEFFAALEAR